MELFERAASVGLQYIQTWLPGGYEKSGQWVVRNPLRNDGTPGSFKINLTTGAFNDYGDPDMVGRDAVTLYAKLHGLRNGEAAREILAKYDPTYFPSSTDTYEPKHEWYQLVNGYRNTPEFPVQKNEVVRWPLEIKKGDSWRVICWIIRYKNGDKKQDIPYTLWTNSKETEWRAKMLHGVKYPLYGLRALTENPNKPFILYEGQKVPSVVQPIIGDDYVCIGWYGGAGNAHLTDFEPLIGREGYFCFDADNPGRAAIMKIIDGLHVKLHLVYPPLNVPKGWDHGDAIAQGYTKEQILELLHADDKTPAPIVPEPMSSPDNRPSHLEDPISDDVRERVLSLIYYDVKDKNGNLLKKISSNWTSEIVEQDKPISQSIKYDYTTGVEATRYDNSTLYIAALEQRLRRYGLPGNIVTGVALDKIIRYVALSNSMYNRVADYMDSLSALYPGQPESVLDEFMSLLQFDTPKNEYEDIDDYEARCKKEADFYRELFDKFFTRMHGHINGTRRTSSGEYKGLIENDIVPILGGPQGCGKTTLCQWIACDHELYADLGSGLKAKFGSAETIKKIRGKLLAEIGEMKIMKTADDVETVKSFISQKEIEVDIKYVENQKKIPMTVSYIGTSNPEQYLSDDTGNRRFWPVKIKDIDKKGLAEKEDLKYRLHAYYAQKTKTMSTNDILQYCRTQGTELEAFADSMRKEALITYSDYEACCYVIKQWRENPVNYKKELNQATVEMLAYKEGYMMRISQRSCKRALADCGLIQKRIKSETTGQYVFAWVNERIKQEEDEIPF